MPNATKPTRAELLAAENKTVRDVIAPGLRVLFCGINPGLYSAATGHHFARPGNRFWPALHAGGFTARIVAPWEERELLALGLGITNLVARATASAAELRPAELVAGRRRLVRKVARYRPAWVAVLGVGAYRAGFGRPDARLGRRERRADGALRHRLAPARGRPLPPPARADRRERRAALPLARRRTGVRGLSGG